MGDFPYIEWLAREYKGRGEISGLWTDYIKAHGLANYCVVKDSTEDRCQLVYSIEDSWYSGRHPLSYVEHQQLIRQQKSRLKSYRVESAANYTGLNVEVDILSMMHVLMNDIFDERYLQRAQLFSKRIFAVSKEISRGLVEMSADIISSSVEILQRIDLIASCKFAVIGLGSLAKGEATPYSDLEYAFIVERDDASYFEKLAVDSYFRIGNLGETPLKHFDIEELAVKEGCTPLFEGHIAAGYRIDGLTKRAGNIPTGNGKDGSQTLTLTVDRLMELYKSSAKSPFDGIAGDLSDMLASTVVIYTNEGERSLLHEKFVRARIVYELGKDRDQQNVHKKRVESFISDITSYTFLPEFIRFQPPKNLDIKVKADIYRYPTLLANNIKMFMGWNLRYSWDIFSNLHKQRMLSDENYRYITIVLALSMYMRTSAYISCGHQTEFVSLMPTTDAFSNSQYYVPGPLFVLLGSLLVPIKQSIKTFADSMSSGPVSSVKEMVTSILQSIKVRKTNYLQQAEVCYFAGRYDLVKLVLTSHLATPLESVSCRRFREKTMKVCGAYQIAHKYVELCCYVLYYTGSYSSAISYFQWLIENKRENVGLLKLLTAHCKREVGEYMDIRHLLDEVKSYGEGSYVADAVHQDAYISYIGIGIVYVEMGEYDTALGYFNKALVMSRDINGEVNHSDTATICNNIGATYANLGNHKLSFEYYMKALDMRKAIHGATSNHPHIANSYNNIGEVYRHLGNCTLALEYHTNSLEMSKALHGNTSNHPDIATGYNNIGNTYTQLGDHARSLEYHTKALEIRKTIHGATSNHPDIATSCMNIGEAYRNLGNNTLALEYHTKSLEMNKAIHGDASNHPAIAGSYNNLGNTYTQLGNHSRSLEYHMKALCIKEAIHGATSNHPDIANSYYDIGCMYNQLGNHSSSLEYHMKALGINRAIHGGTSNHPDIADCYNNIGETYRCLGNYTLALEFHTKSLKMSKAIHGSTSNHPDIADSYNNVGETYRGMVNYTLALEFHTKSLEMSKAIHGTTSNHRTITQSTTNIAHTYRCLGELCTIALEYYTQGNV